MTVKGWGFGTTPHITLVSEPDGTYTLYDGVGRMEDLDFCAATSAVEEEAMQPGGARQYITKSPECTEHWQAFAAAFALHPNNPRRKAILGAHIRKWQKINRPEARPSLSLSDLGLTGK